jgi:hypothetical protein
MPRDGSYIKLPYNENMLKLNLAPLRKLDLIYSIPREVCEKLNLPELVDDEILIVEDADKSRGTLANYENFLFIPVDAPPYSLNRHS